MVGFGGILFGNMMWREIHREERERMSTNSPANPILTNFTYSESLSILPLSHPQMKYYILLDAVILFICFEINGLMWVLIKG